MPRPVTVVFSQGTPFRPFQQLLAVLPSASSQLLPAPFQPLMMNPDSPILDFYPLVFDVDMEGKRAEWEGVVKVPFVDEVRGDECCGTDPLASQRDHPSHSHFRVAVQSSMDGVLASGIMLHLSPPHLHPVSWIVVHTCWKHLSNRVCLLAHLRQHKSTSMPACTSLQKRMVGWS